MAARQASILFAFAEEESSASVSKESASCAPYAGSYPLYSLSCSPYSYGASFRLLRWQQKLPNAADGVA